MSRKSKESIKRLLAIALTFVMVAGLLPFTSVSAYAEETPAPDQTTDVTAPADGEQKETKQTEDIKDETTPLDAGDTTTDPIVTMTPAEGLVYDGTEKQLITAAEVKENYTAKYTVTKDGVDVTAQPVDDITAVKVIAAGTYEIMASITAEDGTVTTEGPVSVTIAKAESDKTITFTDKDGAAIEHNAEISDTITADTYTTTVNITEAYTEGTTAGLISFELKAEDTEIDASSYSYAYNAGVLTLTMKEAGEYKLTATVAGDDNHENSTAAFTLKLAASTIPEGDHIIQVDSNDLTQTVKLNSSGDFSFVIGYKFDGNGHNGKVTAELDDKAIGVFSDPTVNKWSKEITLTVNKANLDNLAELIGDEGFTFDLTIKKAASGALWTPSPADFVKVTVTVKYGTKTLEEGDYSIDGGKLTDDGWYVKDGDVKPVLNCTGLTVSGTLGGEFNNSIELPDGEGVQVFVKETDTGIISKCALPVNADCNGPVTTIDQSEISVWETIWNNISFGSTKPNTTEITISSEDAASGVKEIHVLLRSSSMKKYNNAIAAKMKEKPILPENATDEEKQTYDEEHKAWKAELDAITFESTLGDATDSNLIAPEEIGAKKVESKFSVESGQIYQIEFWAVDMLGNEGEHHTTRNFDEKKVYDYLLVDNDPPVITIESSKPDATNGNTSYFGESYFNSAEKVTVTATVDEANYDLIKEGNSGKALEISVTKDGGTEAIATVADTKKEGKFGREVSYDLSLDGKYTVTATCTDPSGNTTTESMTIVIDTKKPDPSIALPKEAPENKYTGDANTFYFNEDIGFALNAGDANPGTEMEVAPWKDAAFDKVSLSDGTGTYMVTKDGEYKFSLKHTDAAKNTREKEDSITYIRDTVKPTVAVDLGGAARVEGDTHYYNGDINATVNVTEQYFDAGLIETKVDGTRRDVAFKTNADTNVSTSPVKITGDGVHSLSVSGSDKAGNEMEGYNSENLVIDTTIHAPVIGGVANGKAYKDKDIAVNVTGDDTNLDAITVKITKATKDGTETVYSVSEANRSFTYAVPAGQAADGVYTVEATIRDKANNTAAAQTVTFTVNRFGSVYEFGAGVSDINGSHVKAVDNDIVISEYSVNKLKTPLEDNVKISINGKPVSSADVKVQEEHRAGGWYKYTYVIAATSFADDGYYKVEVSSTDSESGKTSGTARYADMGLAFFKDGTKPMIESVLGMEKPTYNENEHSIDFDVYDAIGLASVKVYVDGKEVFSQTDFEDASAFSGKIVLGELSSRQHIRFEIEDLAGNITNTDDDIEPFAPEFEFVPDITVSTNFFVRWYAQPGLFWGTVIGGAALIALVVILIAKKKKTGGEEE